MAEAFPGSITSASTHCFHCGLDIPEGPVPGLTVLGEPRQFCCVGCHAVTKAIVDAGHQDYYRHRQSYAMRKSDEEWQQLLKQSQVLDREEVQRGFVRDTAKGREVWLVLEDIRCSACIWLNEQHLRQLPGIVNIEADFAAAHRLRVNWNPEVVSLSDIIQAIAAMGYVAHPYNPKYSQELDRLKKQRSLERVVFAAILGMVVMHFSLFVVMNANRLNR